MIDLESVVLSRGGHQPDGEFCIMELVAYLAHEPWSDHPACVSPVLASFLRSWNDALDDATRQRLKPYAQRVIGTNTGAADEEARAWLLTDWLVRTFAPRWLDLVKLDAHATALRELPAMESTVLATTATPSIKAAGDAAWDAAWAAAGSAAWSAARDAAGDAAWSAARAAAWAAAGSAAWSAARDAAGDAARSAAGAAAWAAARAAAGDAAWDAAWAAALDALRPTVLGLQESAFDLIDRLIVVGAPS